MIGAGYLSLLAAAITPVPVEPLFDAPKVPDEILADQRGGIRLPNGIEISLSVDTRTSLDGALILQTVVKIDDGPPTVAVYVPKDGIRVEDPLRVGANSVGRATVIYDRQNGIQITSSREDPPVAIAGPMNGTETLNGLERIDVKDAVQSGHGTVSSIGQGLSAGIELRASDLRIVHLNGSAFGSVVINSGNDRVIDTHTTVGIDIGNASPYVLGSMVFRVENIATEAMSRRF